jgi:hypothetical protein
LKRCHFSIQRADALPASFDWHFSQPQLTGSESIVATRSAGEKQAGDGSDGKEAKQGAGGGGGIAADGIAQVMSFTLQLPRGLARAWCKITGSVFGRSTGLFGKSSAQVGKLIGQSLDIGRNVTGHYEILIGGPDSTSRMEMSSTQTWPRCIDRYPSIHERPIFSQDEFRVNTPLIKY